MALYHALSHHLIKAGLRGERKVTLSLIDIEELLGFPLSQPARHDAQWWLGDPHILHARTRSWHRAGWTAVQVHHAGGRPAAVTFDKTHRPALRALIGYLRHGYVTPHLRRIDRALLPLTDMLTAGLAWLLAPVGMFFTLSVEPVLRRLLTIAEQLSAPLRKAAGDVVFLIVDGTLGRLQQRLQTALEALFKTRKK